MVGKTMGISRFYSEMRSPLRWGAEEKLRVVEPCMFSTNRLGSRVYSHAFCQHFFRSCKVGILSLAYFSQSVRARVRVLLEFRAEHHTFHVDRITVRERERTVGLGFRTKLLHFQPCY